VKNDVRKEHKKGPGRWGEVKGTRIKTAEDAVFEIKNCNKDERNPAAWIERIALLVALVQFADC
jgi:hypothetical protein